MLHPATELRFLGSEIGYGIIATEFIPRGTVTWTLDHLDKIIHDPEIKALSVTHGPIIEKYTFKIGQLNVFCWDNAKYINHSCKASSLGTLYGFEVAVVDIAPGMELTKDYAASMSPDDAGFQCYCGVPVCRKVVSDADAKKVETYWKIALKDALKDFYSVSQPLAPLLNASSLRRALRDHQLE